MKTSLRLSALVPFRRASGPALLSGAALLPVAAALALLAPAPRAQDIDVETWAKLLVDHPLAGAGDRDRVVASWLDLIGEEPGHPLVEATLELVEHLQADDVGDPAALADAVAALDGSPFDPWAAHLLQRMQGNLAARRAPVAELSHDLHPDQLARFAVLGPLPPLEDPLAFRSPPPELQEPGFETAHQGLEGEVRWEPLPRSPLRECVLPDAVVEPPTGWALVGACFEAPQGGPAWLELELPPSAPDAALFGTAGGNRARPAPGYAWSLNGGTPQAVELLGREEPSRRHVPVVLRAGRNRLVVMLSLDARTALAVRVLGPDARPLPGLQSVAADDAPLGATVGAQPPTDLPSDSVAFLRAQPSRGPDSELLLGMLQYLDGRQAEGLAHARAASEAAPARPALLAQLSRLTLAAAYLPDTWQKNRARELAEQVLVAQPDHLSMGLHLAGLLADEDQEEEALERLAALTAAHPRQVASLFAQQDTYDKLGMHAQAEAALLDSQRRQPQSAAVLQRLGQFQEQHGQRRRAAELALAALRAGGATGRTLQGVARGWYAAGDLSQAEALYAESVVRDDSPAVLLARARFLQDLDRLDEADALFAQHAARFPRGVNATLARADIAVRRGDREAEIARLREVLERRPSHKSARERLFALTGEEPTEDFFARHRLDADAIVAAWSDAGSKDSVVKVLDHGIVKVFPDGATETLTQDVWQARDLQGCETLGERAAGGDVLRVATIKADGTVFEPVKVGGSYVMPSLKPGDFVLVENRQFRNPPANRVARPGSWSFASGDEPFQLSRYVVSVPKSLPLRLEQKHFEGTHATSETADAVEHVFESRDQPRVLREPGAPPPDWYLPWVEFGMDADPRTIRDGLAATVLMPASVTPEIREAAARATEGLSGDDARARALHAFVNEALDKRGYQSATEGLLSREGNGTWLYAALLEAADIPHEIVWTRDVAPESDGEPDPPFVEPGWLQRKLLVLVSPRDGAPAWCDMDLKLLPYGHLIGDAPRAPAFALPGMRDCTLPDLPLAERPSATLSLDYEVAADGSAQVQGVVDLKAGYGYVAKEQLRGLPAMTRKFALNQAAADLVPGITLEDYALPGLDEQDPPLGIRANGRIATFLDDAGGQLLCKLPLPALNLAAQLAGGEGVRKLPYFLNDPQVDRTQVRLNLGPGLAFAELPTTHVAEFHGGRYELSFEPDGEHGLLIRRELQLPPFVIPADEYPIFAEFCARIDEAERAQLRFTRTAAAAGAVDQPGSSR